ncbi:MAG TPA: hypothetical protein VM050_11180 [Patescibacteria group bacterium]|nr:hypothetical protein [Patescibacteria group bacterium]
MVPDGRETPTERSQRICPVPPRPGGFDQVGRLIRIGGRLLRSFRQGYGWSLLHVFLVASALVSSAVLLPVSDATRSLSSLHEGGSTPVFEVKIPDQYGVYHNFIDCYLASDEDVAWSYFWGDWGNLFTEEDALRAEGLDGVESVARVITYRGHTELGSEWELEKDEWIQGILWGNSSYDQGRRERTSQIAERWNVSMVDYLNLTGPYSRGCNIIGYEVEKARDWSLGFNEITDGRCIDGGEDGIMLNNWWLEGGEDRSLGDTLRLMVGPSGYYNLSDSKEWYDDRKIYSFQIVGAVQGSGYVDAVIDIDRMLEMFGQVRHGRSAPLPLYTSFYVKAATPADSQEVEEGLNKLFPGKTILRVGSAPIMVGEALQSVSGRLGDIYGMTMLLIGGALALSQAAEVHSSRKSVWLIKLRGWGYLDLLSFALLRMALIGTLAGIASVALMKVVGPSVPNLIVPTMHLSSPEAVSYISETVSNTLSGSGWPLVVQGVTATVISGALSIIYLLLTKPPRSG